MKVKYFFVICAILICCGCAARPHVKPTEGIMYTSYNIWKHGSTIFCINFKVGQDVIPAGTKVYDVKIKENKDNRGTTTSKLIKFKLFDTGESVSVRFINRWHPGESIETYKTKMFGHKSFEELTEGLSDEEISAIKRSTIIEGMSKRAVLISYGPPPEHVNKDLSSSKWVYWQNKLKRTYICFDDNGKVMRCWL